MKNTDKKLAILYLLDILKKYTDEKHSLTYAEIDTKLQNEYGIKLPNGTYNLIEVVEEATLGEYYLIELEFTKFE